MHKWWRMGRQWNYCMWSSLHIYIQVHNCAHRFLEVLIYRLWCWSSRLDMRLKEGCGHNCWESTMQMGGMPTLCARDILVLKWREMNAEHHPQFAFLNFVTPHPRDNQVHSLDFLGIIVPRNASQESRTDPVVSKNWGSQPFLLSLASGQFLDSHVVPRRFYPSLLCVQNCKQACE